MLSVIPTGRALGAEIAGVDLARELDEETFGKIVDALHEHEVMFFRNQDLTPEQHIAFSRRFGELEHHVRQDCCRPGYPEIFVVSNIIENGKPIGSQDAGFFWHSDLCYAEKPSRGSLFYAREVPMDNGEPRRDTIFSSMKGVRDAAGCDRAEAAWPQRGELVHPWLFARPQRAGRASRSPKSRSAKPLIGSIRPSVRIRTTAGSACS